MTARPALSDGLQVTWLGHSTFKLRSPGGKILLVDPWLDGNPACPDDQKTIDQLDLMLVTHGHFDHIPDALDIARHTRPQIVAIYEICQWLGSKGIEASSIHDMNKGGTIVVDGISITMVHADHSCGISDGGQIIYGGESVGYVIRFENGFTLYHTGDTAVFGDMSLIARIYEPEVAVLPIGDHFTMGPREAAVALELLGVRRCVPCHYGTFPLLTGTPEELRRLAPDVEVLELEPGETVSL